MKKKLITCALLITGLVTVAQQDAQFSMNMFNRLAVNPAYAGMNKALCATLLYRQQWTSFPGAPKTGLLSVDFGEVAHGGIGMTVDQDQLGFEKTLNAKLAYSFHLPLGPGNLGIGLEAGMLQKGIAGTFIAPDGSIGSGPDQAIPWTGASATTYDLGFGLYYTTNRMYIGLSSDHLPEQQLKQTNFDYKVARNYYVMAGYTFQLGSQFDLTPSVLAKSDASATQLDLNLLAKWNRMVFGGFSYRISDAMVAIIGLERSFTPKITAKFGYSYDITTSTIKNYSSGSHEIMLGFCYKIKSEPKPSSHMNVRFL